MKLFMIVRTWHYSFFFFIVIFVIVLFSFYYSCVVFVLFMAWFNVLFSFFYSCIVFVSLYKAYESIVLGRHGKTGGSGRVNRVTGQNGSIELWVESGWVYPYFSNKFFFFFFSITKTNQLQPV